MPSYLRMARLSTNFLAYRIGGILSDKWRGRTVPVTRCPKPIRETTEGFGDIGKLRVSLGNGLASEEVPAAVVRNQQFTADELCQRCPYEKKTDTRVAPCLLIEFSFRTRSGLRERLLAPSEYSGSGTRLLGEISNERAGYLHFHGFFFAYLCSGILDFNFISTRNDRAVAKRSYAVLPGMALARILLPLDASLVLSPVTRNCQARLEFYGGGN